ncbi:hypothetical protein PAAG_00679 [Paracoccidioides lutzii Pb01]|uniref:Tat pathway signal sequence n=1 Tax=Paracoccidioides lutzii (strain ATCC MYA-826 / Pb01) TaxID=502779 RepID=C1GQ84_PARBA|nr:hypothetical protein PAAG_00679 [Paracoccidioides lutzii Pb01]EEH37758.2 hypothetical protein PAAG_00679 [Paracoccidioides lutzii Pb01]
MAYFTKLRQIAWYKGKSQYAYRAPESPGSSPRRPSEEKGSDDGLLEEIQYHTFSNRRPLWKNGRFMIIAHIVGFSLYVGSLVALWKSKNVNAERIQGMPFSPAVKALEWKDTMFSLEDRITEKGSFSGMPSAELDKAWHDLLNDENIMVESKYIKHYDREDITVRIPDGDGYIGTLNVYHELHCLKRIHQYMYPDYYFTDLSAEDIEMNRLHNEHCIDFLRQSAMCHGDIGLITFEWHDSSRIPIANATSHQCVNWKKLEQWTKARTVDMMKPGWLVHPVFGVAYPTGEGDKIGAASGHH